MCPNPPVPLTWLVGLRSNCTIGLKTAMPPQNNGPEQAESLFLV